MSEKNIVTLAQDPIRCPHCAGRIGGFSGDAVPETGDWSCCYLCHKISRFIVPPGGPLSLRKATPSELVEFARDDRELAEVLAKADEEIATALREVDAVAAADAAAEGARPSPPAVPDVEPGDGRS